MTVPMKLRAGAAALRAAAVVLAASGGLWGCSYFWEPAPAPRAPAKGAVEIWRSGDQYVRLEPPATLVGGRPPRNVHPVLVSADRLRAALGQIMVKKSPGEASQPLFTPASLDVLSRSLAAGLARARPDQDVTFAVDQRTPGFLGFTDTEVVSGRVFFTGDWLHLIFGSVLGPDVVEEGPVFDSYLPGRRDVRLGDPVILLAPPGSGIYRAPGVDRSDWLVFVPWALAARPPAPPAPRPGWPQPPGPWPQGPPPRPAWPQGPPPQSAWP